jgi:hypothetical protein
MVIRNRRWEGYHRYRILLIFLYIEKLDLRVARISSNYLEDQLSMAYHVNEWRTSRKAIATLLLCGLQQNATINCFEFFYLNWRCP